MTQSYIDPAQAVLNANEYGEALIRRASEGDRSTGAEVDAIMKNPGAPVLFCGELTLISLLV